MKIDEKLLRQTASMSFEQIADKYGAWSENRYIYVDNHAPILGVMHSDFVGMADDGAGDGWGVFKKKNSRYLISGALDDRLGLYAITDFLPRYGVVADWLITQDEEKGKSTATYFKTEKQYNWIFSFDRRGLDVVLYAYSSEVLREFLESAGYTVGTGSYSCIAELQHLRAKGFNFGVGYHNEHTDLCNVSVYDFLYSMARFINFYEANRDIRFEHQPVTYYSYTVVDYRDSAPCQVKGCNNTFGYRYADTRNTYLFWKHHNDYLAGKIKKGDIGKARKKEIAKLPAVKGTYADVCDWCGQRAYLSYNATAGEWLCAACQPYANAGDGWPRFKE